MDVPVLLVAFNRPDKLQHVFDRVKLVQPTQLFLSVDGARLHKPGESDKVRAVQDIARQVDWPCTVKTLFRDENLGCRKAVSTGISWFFEHVDAGIILEDDCVPHLSFFSFCAELLERYQNDEQVMQIAGSNLIPEKFSHIPSSYVFSNFALIWGWATWKRAWKKMDVDLKELPEFKKNNRINTLISDKTGQTYLLDKFDETRNKVNDSWAYAWFYSLLHHNGLSILPVNNLIENIGVDEEATHTRKGLQTEKFQQNAAGVSFPLIHPKRIEKISPSLAMEIFYANYKPKLLLWVNKIVPLWILKRMREIRKSF